MKISPVTIADFRSMEIDWHGEKHMDYGMPPATYWEAVLEVAATAGLFVDGVLTFVLGMIPDGTGICTVFVLSSVHLKKRQIQKLILKHANRGIRLLQQIYSPHRLQAIVFPENPQHVSFIEHFGFEREGVLKHYTPRGEDVWIYGRRA